MIAFIIKNRVLILIVIILLMAASISGITYLYLKQIKISNRHETNYDLRGDTLSRFKDKNGDMYVLLQETQLTVSELKESNNDKDIKIYEQAKKLGIKDRQIEQLISIEGEVKVEKVFIHITDTLIIRENLPDITRMASIETKYMNAYFAIYKDTLEIISASIPVDLFIAIHWFKERKLFFMRWIEKKKHGISIQSENPYVKITHAKNIRITKQVGR